MAVPRGRGKGRSGRGASSVIVERNTCRIEGEKWTTWYPMYADMHAISNVFFP
jgi:hypothetical protein